MDTYDLQKVKVLRKNDDRHVEYRLPKWLTEHQKRNIVHAIENYTPIIISGKQGPTGKTTLKYILASQGLTVYEEWECMKITLNNFLKVLD